MIEGGGCISAKPTNLRVRPIHQVYRSYDSQGVGYELLAQDERAHSRMVLDCCWSPDGHFFATASRDKSVKIWSLAEEKVWTARSTIKLAESITAVDMRLHGSVVLLAVGTENGAISIYEIRSGNLEATLLIAVDAA